MTHLRLAPTVVTLLLCSAAAAQTPPTPLPFVFETGWRGFVTGTSAESDPWFPFDQEIVDLDGDGDLDVAVVNRGNLLEPAVSVLLNQGEGFFSRPAFYALIDNGEAITSADFDGDGDVDLLATEDGPNNQRGNVALLRNVGGGTFEARQAIATHPSDGPTGVAAGDLDGDGDVDFATANYGRIGGGTTVSIRYNDGFGRFGEGPTLTTGQGPNGIIIRDVIGSGLPEIIVSTDAGTVEVFERAGDAYSSLVLSVPVNGRNVSSHVRAADVDGDGDLDLGVTGLGLQLNRVRGVAVLLNNGVGFDGPVFSSLGGAPAGGNQLAFGDVTGDGVLDMAVVVNAGDRWYVLEGVGDGSFLPSERVSGEYPRAVDVADIDGDGDRDVVIAAEMSNGVYVHRNEGAGGFGFPYERSGNSTFDNLAITSGDIDNDSDIDVVSAGDRFNVFVNSGSGDFADSRLRSFGPDCQELELRDISGDGYVDLLWINRDESPPYHFHTALNDGAGGFGPAVTWPIDTCGSEDIDASDLDGDGDLDVVVTEWLGCMGLPESGQRLFLGRNNGDGTFELLPPLVLPQSAPAAIAFGDFNEDGITDLAVGTNPLSVGIGRGDLTFDFIEIGGLGIDLEVADLNSDGHLDIVSMVVDNTDFLPGAGVLMGRGDGSFAPMRTFLTSWSPNLRTGVKVEIGDFDGDGVLDLATVNTASHDVSFLKGLGDGGFEDEVRFGLGEGPLDMTAADFNGDGVDDLAASLTLLVTQTGGGVRWLFATGADGGCPADFNGDGQVNTQDVLAFLNAWAAGDSAADFNGDGDVNTLDVLAFLNAWSAGC